MNTNQWQTIQAANDKAEKARTDFYELTEFGGTISRKTLVDYDARLAQLLKLDAEIDAEIARQDKAGESKAVENLGRIEILVGGVSQLAFMLDKQVREAKQAFVNKPPLPPTDETEIPVVEAMGALAVALKNHFQAVEKRFRFDRYVYALNGELGNNTTGDPPVSVIYLGWTKLQSLTEPSFFRAYIERFVSKINQLAAGMDVKSFKQ